MRAMLLPALTLHVSDVAAGLAQTFWHSSAHVLGEALEACFGAKLTIGPALEEGFYYDCYLGERTLTEADKAALEQQVQQVSAEPLPACITLAPLCVVSRHLWDIVQPTFSHASFIPPHSQGLHQAWTMSYCCSRALSAPGSLSPAAGERRSRGRSSSLSAWW